MMKNFKIFTLAMMVVAMLSSCENQKESGGSNSELAKGIAKEWQLTQWGGADGIVDVYVDFNEDGSFEMYQRVYSLNYVCYTGTYSVKGDKLTGSYADGTDWKCAYKGTVSSDGNTLTLTSDETASVTSVYTTTTIPEDVKAEADSTRADDVERFF